MVVLAERLQVRVAVIVAIVDVIDLIRERSAFAPCVVPDVLAAVPVAFEDARANCGFPVGRQRLFAC
ncbi:hypothetical protein [Microbacterium lacus]|uniref:hypothetical protein n=1 Tax=Microbacterium lacus TaxID=415217 RepID=UPI0012FDD87F|nr:hypothetical protein [Microbacterium lacus]